MHMFRCGMSTVGVMVGVFVVASEDGFDVGEGVFVVASVTAPHPEASRIRRLISLLE